jgi:folate-dependent phosphoribosylglycinamide formyltransferase PurN
MKNIAVLVSGGGTNLQALIDAQNRGEIKNGKISLVVSSNPNAYLKEQKTIRLQLRLSEEKTMTNLMSMILL